MFSGGRRRGEIGKRCLFQAPFPLPLPRQSDHQQDCSHSFIHTFILVDISKRFVCDYLAFPVGHKKLSACIRRCPLQVFFVFALYIKTTGIGNQGHPVQSSDGAHESKENVVLGSMTQPKNVLIY